MFIIVTLDWCSGGMEIKVFASFGRNWNAQVWCERDSDSRDSPINLARNQCKSLRSRLSDSLLPRVMGDAGVDCWLSYWPCSWYDSWQQWWWGWWPATVTCLCWCRPHNWGVWRTSGLVTAHSQPPSRKHSGMRLYGYGRDIGEYGDLIKTTEIKIPNSKSSV